MKKYSLKINGNQYEVKIDDVNEASTLAHVTVNGTKYTGTNISFTMPEGNVSIVVNSACIAAGSPAVLQNCAWGTSHRPKRFRYGECCTQRCDNS